MSCTWKNLFVDKNIPLREVGNRISKISTFFRSFFNTNFKVLNFEYFVLFQSIYIYYKVQISNNKNTVKLWKTKSCSMCNSLSSTCSQSFVKNKKLFSYFRGCYIMTANNINNTRIIFEKKLLIVLENMKDQINLFININFQTLHHVSICNIETKKLGTSMLK